MIEGWWVTSDRSLSSGGCALMGRTWVHAKITHDSIFREPAAGHWAVVKYGKRNVQMKQLGSSCLYVPLLRLFFSLPFGCLAVANSFVCGRGSDFSLDFGPAERDVDTHTSA